MQRATLHDVKKNIARSLLRAMFFLKIQVLRCGF